MKIIEDLIIFTWNRFVIVKACPLIEWRLPVTLMPVVSLIDLIFFIVLYFVSDEKLFYDHIIINIEIQIFWLYL